MANAFDEMNNAAGNDMNITGGAIFNSEYENNMSPDMQKEFEFTLKRELLKMYSKDELVHKNPVSFKFWLKQQNGEDMEALADTWQNKLDTLTSAGYDPEIDTHNTAAGYAAAMEGMGPFPKQVSAWQIQSLAHLHTGRIEDLFDIVANMEDWKNQDMNPETGFVQY